MNLYLMRLQTETILLKTDAKIPTLNVISEAKAMASSLTAVEAPVTLRKTSLFIVPHSVHFQS